MDNELVIDMLNFKIVLEKDSIAVESYLIKSI